MYNITLIKGDGIGYEVSEATKLVLDSIDTNFNIEEVNAGADVFEQTGELVPDTVYESIEKNKVVIKGPITTPVGAGFRSINVHLRKKYDLYSNVRPIKSTEKNIDFVIFRENTEGLYIGEEELTNEGAIAIKRITRAGCERIIKSAFEYAKNNNIKKVTVAHKANILKLADGLFLEVANEVAKDYPNIELEPAIIDAMCMNLVMRPENYSVVVTMNLYGDILSDLGAGLVGGLGLIPGANIGKDIAIFEAVHGSAPDIAGKGIANPIALIRSAVLMLEHLGEEEDAKKLNKAVNKVLDEKAVVTKDLGGTATTMEVANEIIRQYKEV